MGGTPAAVYYGNLAAVLRSRQFAGHCNMGTVSDYKVSRSSWSAVGSPGCRQLAPATQTPVPPVSETSNYQEQEATINEITLSHLEQ